LNNILFLRGAQHDKINLFSKLTHQLNKRDIECTNLTFDIIEEYLYNCHNIETLKVSDIKVDHFSEFNKYSSKEMNNIIYFEEKFNEKVFGQSNKDKLIKITKCFMEKLKELDNLYSYDAFLMWNNNFLFDRIAYYYAKKNNKDIFVIEQGSFRPFTLAIDKKGVNFESSIPKTSEFYKNLNFDKQLYNSFLETPIKATKDKTKYYNNNLYKIMVYLNICKKVISGGYLEPNYINFFTNLVSKLINNKKNKLKNKITNNQSINFNKRYIFVPLQVETDSQIIFFSPSIKDMEELVVKVSEKVKEYNNKFNDNIDVIFKSHPKDSRVDLYELKNKVNKYQNSYLIVKGNTKKYIKNSELVITINSTVGIEALIEKKSVITLGKSFYNIEDIVLHCSKIKLLPEYIKKALEESVNQELIERFLFYLRFIYFKEIYWKNSDIKSISKLVDFITE
jgi:capsule polysaccharide modification protein KpsS